jgi:hypothetical protein
LVDDCKVVAPPFVVARLLVGLGWMLANAVAGRYFAVRPVQFEQGLVAWDGAFYRDIADLGYHALPVGALRFFPLYPLLGRALAAPFGSGSTVALLVLANVIAFAVAVVIRRLVLFEKGEVALADRSVWLITLFPSAFVFVWAYSESLMILAAAAALLALRRRRWWWAAAFGLLAGATRPVGAAVAVAALVEVLRERDDVPVRDWLGRAAAVIAPIAGAGAYLAWVGHEFGNWTLPFSVQNDLRGEGANPLTRLVFSGVRDMFGAERFHDGLHVPFAIAFVVLAGLTFRRWPASYGAYATAVLVAALSADNLNSVERYGLNAFPIILTLALLLNTQRWERLGLAICGSGMVALSSLAWLSVYVP